MHLVNADRKSKVSALGMGLPSRASSGVRTGVTPHASRLTIAWKYRVCTGHEDLLLRDGVQRQAGKCDCLRMISVGTPTAL